MHKYNALLDYHYFVYEYVISYCMSTHKLLVTMHAWDVALHTAVLHVHISLYMLQKLKFIRASMSELKFSQ